MAEKQPDRSTVEGEEKSSELQHKAQDSPGDQSTGSFKKKSRRRRCRDKKETDEGYTSREGTIVDTTILSLTDMTLENDGLNQSESNQEEDKVSQILVHDGACFGKHLLSDVRRAHEDVKQRLSQLVSIAKLTRNTTLKDDKKLQILVNIIEVYLDVGQFKEARDVVEEAKSHADQLGATLEAENSRARLYCYAAEAYEGLRKRRKAVHYCQLAVELLRQNPNAGSSMLQSRLDTLRLRISWNEEDDDRINVTKTLGPSGGEIILADGAIKFSQSALPSLTILHALTTDLAGDSEEQLIPVSPGLSLAPNIDLKVPAEVTLKTWITPSSGEQIFAYFRDSPACPWTDPRPVILQDDGRAKFEIKKFCEYGVFIQAKAVMNWDFKIQTCLFVNRRTKKLSNRLTTKCDTCLESLTRKMAARNFEPCCTEDPTITAKVGDEVEVRVDNIRDKGMDKPAPRPKKATISIEFLRDKTHGVQDFLLPHECTGLVDFHHKVQVYRANDKVGHAIIHDDDRIDLDFGKRGTFITAGAVATDQATIYMSEGKLNVGQDPVMV